MRNQIRARKQTNGYKENSKLLNNCRETDTCIQNAILKIKKNKETLDSLLFNTSIEFRLYDSFNNNYLKKFIKHIMLFMECKLYLKKWLKTPLSH